MVCLIKKVKIIERNSKVMMTEIESVKRQRVQCVGGVQGSMQLEWLQDVYDIAKPRPDLLGISV